MRRHPQPSGLRRRITALLSLPILLLVLSGCFRADISYEIGTDGTTDVHAQGVALSPAVTRADVNCQELAEDDSPVEGATVTAEDYEENGLVGCTLEASGPTDQMVNDDGSYIVTQDGDTLTFSLQGDPTIDVESMAALGTPEMTTTVVFPGDVIDGGGGEVNGNEVTFTGIEWYRDGITATGSASAGFLDSIPGWALWTAIGVVVALVLLIIILAVTRGNKKKRAAAAQGGPGGPGGYGAGGGYGGQQQWGGPQGGQPGWDQGGQQWGAGQQQWGGQPGWGAQSPDQAQWGGQPGWGAQSPGQGQQGWDQGGQGGQPWGQGGQQPPQQGQGWS